MSFIYLKTKVFTRNAMKDRVDLKLKKYICISTKTSFVSLTCSFFVYFLNNILLLFHNQVSILKK